MHSLNNIFLTVMEAFVLAGISGLGSKWLNLPQITWNSLGDEVKCKPNAQFHLGYDCMKKNFYHSLKKEYEFRLFRNRWDKDTDNYNVQYFRMCLSINHTNPYQCNTII